jgi:hypothetical protein
MVRHTVIVIACALLLASCGRGQQPADLKVDVLATRPGFAPPPDINIASDAPAQPSGGLAQQFTYSHSWSLILAHAALTRHFEAAREACLKDRTLDCKLVSANMSNDGDTAQAQLSVLLPHASLDRFEHLLREPRAGEKADDVRLTSRATRAESVENAAADSNRKVAQLSGYRDRLADIAKRPNLSVDDLIKLEAEQARVETELDEALAEQRGIDSGLKRESVDVSMTEQVAPPPSQMVQLLGEAGATLGTSTANMIIFVIGALPWLPLILAGVWVLVRLVRLAWRRRPRANIAASASEPLAKPVSG